MKHGYRLLVGYALDDAAAHLPIGGVLGRQQPERGAAPVPRYELPAPIGQFADKRQIGEAVFLDGFCQRLDGGFLHGVDGVCRVVFDGVDVEFCHWVFASGLGARIEQSADGEPCGHVTCRAH